MFEQLHKRISGGSLPEVLTALVIMSVCTSLAFVIYLNIQKSATPFIKLKAMEIAEQVMKESLHETMIDESETAVEEFIVKRFVGIDERYPDCFLIRIVVFDSYKNKVYELHSSLKRKS